MEENIPVYYVTLKPVTEDGKEADGTHNIAYVEDPAVEEFGIYLEKQDNRIVAEEKVQDAILEYLKGCGQELPSHWKEVSEEEYLQAKEVQLTTDPTTRESFNDVSKGDGTGQWLVRYVYDGPKDSKNRSFCARILALDRIYTEEEIKNGLSNPEFGNYSIWDYKGSYGCRHRWKRQIYFEDYEDKEVRKVGFVPKVTSGLDDKEATTLNAYLSKDEKMQVVAPLLIPDKDVYRNDSLGQYNMRFSSATISELRDKANTSKLFNKKDLFKDTHQGGVAPAYVIKEWLIEDENDPAYTEYGFKAERVPVGTWMVHSQITDKGYWEREIKGNGKHSYSIEALINMSVIEMSNQINKDKMTEEQIVLPDGEHLIDGKIYIVEGGKVTATKEVTDQQEDVVEDVAEKKAKEDGAEEMKSDKPKEDEKPKEEMSEDKKEEPKEEMKSEDKPKEEMSYEEKPKEEMAEDEKPEDAEGENSEKSEIESLRKEITELKDMIAEMKASEVEKDEPVEVQMKKQPYWKGVSSALDQLGKNNKNR